MEAAPSIAEGSSVHTGQEAAGPALSHMQISQMADGGTGITQDGILEVEAGVCQSRGPGHKGKLWEAAPCHMCSWPAGTHMASVFILNQGMRDTC